MDDGKVLSYYIEGIARVCHQANKAYCEMFDDFSQVDWEELSEELKNCTRNGVEYRLNNLYASPKEQHNQWCMSKIEDGWHWGEVKDSEKKTHPCLVDWEELPVYQRVKDLLFANVVRSIHASKGE